VGILLFVRISNINNLSKSAEPFDVTMATQFDVNS
jgi:hypothetical protein